MSDKEGRDKPPFPVRPFSDARLLSDESLWDFIQATPETTARMAADPGRARGCPPMHRFALPADLVWSDEERQHISSCDRCQNTMSLAWRAECPTVDILLGFLAQGEAFADRHAIRLHRQRDNCARCARLLENPALNAVAQAMRLFHRVLPLIAGTWVKGEQSGGLSVSNLSAAALGIAGGWFEQASAWVSPEPVLLGEDDMPDEPDGEAPFVTLEGPENCQALFEIDPAGRLSVTFSGLTGEMNPPVCALINQDGVADAFLLQPRWNASKGCWTVEVPEVSAHFRVVMLPSQGL